MASVSSLDKDLARSRRARYTPEAAGEVATWIQSVLQDSMPPGELMDQLKDGTMLCRLANVLDPSKQIKFKKSAMPFVQMENISHFLSFVSKPPVSLPPHDLFLTVDLFEKKDPAQVVQCLTSFSRVAHRMNPSAFPGTVGGVKAALTAQLTGSSDAGDGMRVVSSGDKPAPRQKLAAVSTWSRKTDEGATLPAWNIAQYGYMGGASQGNQGISFGGRRQITGTPVSTNRPKTPASVEFASITKGVAGMSFVDREKVRKEQAEEEARKKREAQEAEAARQREIQEKADLEARKRAEADEAEAARRKGLQEEQERAAVEEERRLLKEEEQKRLEWQKEQARKRELDREKEDARAATAEKSERERERERIRQLEQELERARERERAYEAEIAKGRQEKLKQHKTGDEERRFLQGAWKAEKETQKEVSAPSTPTRTLRIFQRTPGSSPPKPPPRALPTPPRKLPVPTADLGRSDSTASWTNGDDLKPLDSPAREQKEFKWARMSLLERERERERERQKEWERSQQETQQLADAGVNDGEGWDVNQYGYADDILDLY